MADKGNTFGTVKCSSSGACQFLKNVPEKIDAIHKRLDKVMIENRDFASSISTQHDENSAVIGSNLDYAAIHQLRSQAGKNKKVEIPARPYLKLTDDDFNEILDATEHYLK